MVSLIYLLTWIQGRAFWMAGSLETISHERDGGHIGRAQPPKIRPEGDITDDF